MNEQKISCSGRKDWQVHIRDWIDFQRTHAKFHSNLHFELNEIDYVYGQPEGYSPLFGGRLAKSESNALALTKHDLYWMYDHNIGMKITLSNKSFNDFMYAESRMLLDSYHHPNNAIIVANDKLAERIKQDYPLYKIELSAVRDIMTTENLNKAIETNLYDTIVLPMIMNDDMEFLNAIENKKQIRMFTNAECSYSCPNKVCYGTTGQINSGKLPLTDDEGNSKMMCSHYDLKLPRLFYNDNINWSEYYFDIDKLKRMGFEKFKVLPSVEQQGRTHIMYK